MSGRRYRRKRGIYLTFPSTGVGTALEENQPISRFSVKLPQQLPVISAIDNTERRSFLLYPEFIQVIAVEEQLVGLPPPTNILTVSFPNVLTNDNKFVRAHNFAFNCVLQQADLDRKVYVHHFLNKQFAVTPESLHPNWEILMTIDGQELGFANAFPLGEYNTQIFLTLEESEDDL